MQAKSMNQLMINMNGPDLEEIHPVKSGEQWYFQTKKYKVDMLGGENSRREMRGQC